MSPTEKSGDGNGEGDKHYPPPLASHEHIVKDPVVFWDTLRRFHFLMGTKFLIPVIGGKELDLHVLYIEATKRGGYEKVVVEKKWREVGTVFKFSATTTSASFVLRKHYCGLLYHYEQVHFFNFQGPLRSPPPPPAATPPATTSCKSHKLSLLDFSSKRIKKPPNQLADGSSTFEAAGIVEGKFDCGYIVSVKLGSEVLKGVLYHPKDPESPASPFQQCSNALVPYTPSCRMRHSRRRRRSRKYGDPSYPKPNRSGYNFFFAEKHYKLKSLYPNREREFTKIIGQSWNNLNAEEKMVYQNIGLEDKERYKRELKEYREKMNQRQATIEAGRSDS